MPRVPSKNPHYYAVSEFCDAVGLARLAQYDAAPGPARVPWGGEHAATVASLCIKVIGTCCSGAGSVVAIRPPPCAPWQIAIVVAEAIVEISQPAAKVNAIVCDVNAIVRDAFVTDMGAGMDCSHARELRAEP